MKIYTSYFYQIRFFTPNMIPISTAAWDPRWYHDFKDSQHVFLDKNRVINGLRADSLVLPESYARGLEISNLMCTKNCKQNPPYCGFMNAYRLYLDTVDFDDIIDRCERISNLVQKFNNYLGEPECIFMVHEGPGCICAERPVLQEWFNKHGIECVEWQR